MSEFSSGETARFLQAGRNLSYMQLQSATETVMNFTWIESIFEEAEYGADLSLRALGRVLALLFLCSLVMACWSWSALKERFARYAPGISSGREYDTFSRPHKVQEFIYNCFCCGWCCPFLHSKTGFDALQPIAPEWLRITFILASDIEERTNFFFEVWTEPSDGWPKHTQLNNEVYGQRDLGFEAVDLEWYGDERFLVIQVVEYRGDKQHSDAPIGELRLPQSAILRYAAEASRNELDVRLGSRSFPMKRASRDAGLERSTRFKDPNPVLPLLLDYVTQSDQGGSGGDELSRLREENDRLLTQNQYLSGRLGMAASPKDDESEVMMKLVARIQIVERRSAPSDMGLFTTPSFHEEDFEEA